MEQSITLNIPSVISNEEKELILGVFTSMDGWLAANNGYFWYGNSPDSPYIYAEFQSGGLVVTGCVDEVLWIGWIIKFCAKLSIALQREVYDAGIGEWTQ